MGMEEKSHTEIEARLLVETAKHLAEAEKEAAGELREAIASARFCLMRRKAGRWLPDVAGALMILDKTLKTIHRKEDEEWEGKKEGGS